MPYKEKLKNPSLKHFNKHRSRLYREHKYVFFVFSEMLQFIGSLDFSELEAAAEAENRLQKLKFLLKGHADYEESRIHALLKKKGSLLCQEAEMQHKDQDLFFEKAEKWLTDIEKSANPGDKNHLGYIFYLELREFFAQNLIHFDYEEKVILPELQRLVSDDDIREIDSQSYRQMTSDQMIQMMEVLFPHMNSGDRLTFLKDIKDCQPEKFEAAWQGISSKFSFEQPSKLESNTNSRLSIKEAQQEYNENIGKFPV